MCHVSERLPWLGEGEARAGVEAAAEGTAGQRWWQKCSEAESDSEPSESAPEIKDM